MPLMRGILSSAVGGVLVLAFPAGAVAGTAGVAGTAPAAAAVQGGLNAVSCPGPGACTAVGSYVSTAGTVSLAEGWNGTAWPVQPTPDPAGGSDDTLSGVSCGAAGSCLAVGGYFSGDGNSPLAETWNGTNWTLQPVPLPAGALAGDLTGVSCTSASTCI